MPIYQPPKKSGVGGYLSTAGDVTLAGSGVLAATGVGALPAVITGAVGGLMKGIGSILDSNEQGKIEDYNNLYKKQVEGEKNQQQSADNSLQQSKINYTQQGVSSSVKAINEMMDPTTSKSIVNNRLI